MRARVLWKNKQYTLTYMEMKWHGLPDVISVQSLDRFPPKNIHTLDLCVIGSRYLLCGIVGPTGPAELVSKECFAKDQEQRSRVNSALQ